MENSLMFSVAVVFCFGAFIISAKEAREDDVSISHTEIESNYTPVDTAINKEFRFNGSELGVDRADECKCKNGTCMRACDFKKTAPCDDQKMVCVCNREFGKKGEDECEYCDCGEGNDCTFDWRYNAVWWKTCICRDGYFFNEYRSSKCLPDCRKYPCKHKGTCDRYGSDNLCSCYRGTRGALCEEVKCDSKCQNRLEVDCLFDEYNKAVYCNCKNSSLYYDQEADICKPCQCGYGYCDYEYENKNQKLVCKCHFGYKEFNGYCKKCDCGHGVDGECEFDSNGEKICKCLDSFYEKDGRCKACGCHGPNDMETKCEVIDNVKRCKFCKEGFKDVQGRCEDIDECETGNPCPPLAKCYNTFGSFYCECPKGYKGTDDRYVEPEEECKDINECLEIASKCWFKEGVKCVNLPGSYKCECLPGYEPNRYSDEPSKTICISHRKHWGPAVIVVCVTLLLIAVSFCVHKRVKNRLNSN